MVVLLVFQVGGQAFAPPPPDASGAAISWLAQPLIFAALAFWLDKKRTI